MMLSVTQTYTRNTEAKVEVMYSMHADEAISASSTACTVRTRQAARGRAAGRPGKSPSAVTPTLVPPAAVALFPAAAHAVGAGLAGSVRAAAPPAGHHWESEFRGVAPSTSIGVGTACLGGCVRALLAFQNASSSAVACSKLDSGPWEAVPTPMDVDDETLTIPVRSVRMTDAAPAGPHTSF